MVKVLSAKVPEELIAGIDAAAEARGVTRNRLVREVLEAAVDGRVTFLAEEEERSRRQQAAFETLRRQLSSSRR